jgi:hypothetical protein
MRVNVIEAGQDGAALRVEDFGIRAAQAIEVLIAADPQDAIAADGDGFLKGVAGGRVDFAVGDEEVGLVGG